MLYLVNEMIFTGYNVYSLDLLYLIAILLGILVIISKNPIVSVLFLIGLFLCISAYLILTGLNFIGLSYLLVYIGAISILFLFILMLINVRISELLIDSINSIPLAILIGCFFNYFVNNVLPYMVMTSNLLYHFSIKKKLTNVTSVSWDGYLAETSHITSIGNILYGNYSIWLIITSIILLLAMVGCIVITLKEKKCNINSGLVKHSLIPPLTSKTNFVSSRSFSTISKPQESSICTTNITGLWDLSSGWVTGFSDGESSFYVVVRKDNTYKSGWTIIPAYKIELQKRDLAVLQAIQKFLVP
jgi:NADH-ubiquinone oxidoreductase chain 6